MDSKAIIPIDHEIDIVIARQKGREMAKEFGFSNLDQALIATAISELARNIITYAIKGSVTLICSEELGAKRRRLQVIVADNGPGIENIELALQDGYSTSNSLGLGLPGVRRLMDDFKIESTIGKGTTVTATKWIY